MYTPADYQASAAVSDDPSFEAVKLTEKALRIHHSAILVDGHNDLPGKIRNRADSSFDKLDISQSQLDLHTDIERLKKGGVGAQFWAAYVPPSLTEKGAATRYALEQIDLIRRMAQRYPDVFEMAFTADDIVRIHRKGKIASLIGVEGGHAIENSLRALRRFYERGARYMTLTHSRTIDWADSCSDEPLRGGLTSFGEQVVREMNRLGMLVDISHVSADTMRHVLRVSEAPVIASHSSAFAVVANPRNVPDDVLRLVADNGGVIMVNFSSGFVHPDTVGLREERRNAVREILQRYPDQAEARRAVQQWRRDNPLPRGTVHTLVDHIEHIVQVAGIDHAGIGSDYDGISRTPVQLEDVSCFPFITQVLLDRGNTEEDIRKILGGNLIRAFREAEEVARKGKK